ncbi:hypothetical protein GDO86_011330 [Hymenochirus boettgeri]|uniref:Uncharacterized protein n=1 Tax=Hymenochirus boettgeri TaxID=247094 RepID=A0A8T2JJ39_9PIPI|nr:hypothetical protein GDO86_011330 [Hymenochirus boettgeri]
MSDTYASDTPNNHFSLKRPFAVQVLGHLSFSTASDVCMDPSLFLTIEIREMISAGKENDHVSSYPLHRSHFPGKLSK